VTARTLTLRGDTYPLMLPSIRDPRLHVAAVIITIHVLGQVTLGFRVSIPQILAAILTCAVMEIAITFRTAKAFVWPASAMLTGSGVALILRLVGQPPNQPWDTNGWYVFAVVAGLSLATKYVIKYRGTHIFNPSNIGLVVAFLVLGMTRVEPLDFWWGPLDPGLLLAYAVILGGGLLITRRLHLLAMAATFWVTLAAGLGVLATSGHCMTANWAFAPVCGVDYWRVIVTSPEVMIFLFFMITDPKTIPAGNVGRVLFAFLVGVASTLLMAPQTDEWWTKVSLLSGLVLVCALRPLLDRVLPEPKTPADNLRTFAVAPGIAGAALALGTVLLVGAGIVLAGSPARGTVVRDTTATLDVVPLRVDPETLPPITVSDEVLSFDHDLDGPEMQAVVVTLAENIEFENEALLSRDPSILTAIDHGDRLDEMRARVAAAEAGEPIVLTHYLFDAIDVSLLVPFGQQTGLSLGLASAGTKVEETYDAAGQLTERVESPFEETFAMRRATGDRWLTVGVLPQAP
jgi:Na+-translocating ferredoxin:NAD+ oxidoreductase RnfD subunit